MIEHIYIYIVIIDLLSWALNSKGWLAACNVDLR
jgi:hypothetical protein